MNQVSTQLLFAHDEKHFKTLDETQIVEIFNQDVSLPESDFDNLICKVAWMLSRWAKGSGGVVHIVIIGMKIHVPEKLILAPNPDVLLS